MPFAFTHLVTAWFVGLIIQTKKKLNKLSWGLLLLGSILPDGDYIFQWIFNVQIHRSISHSLLFLIISYLILYFILKNYKKEKYAIYLTIGVTTHLFLDLFIYPGIMLLWPLQYWISIFGVSLTPSVKEISVTYLTRFSGLAIMDMILGVAWLAYLFIKGKLKF
ncbi:metal-dependent hydrolase [Candidatus Woesearchaeota archaeon]|nr:metal-dependent hydrolase [Candidatus Woesearchaeota archaeon]